MTDPEFSTTTLLGRPFTTIADDDVVLASGWTDDPEYLLALIHRDIRPAELTHRDDLGHISESIRRYETGELDAVDSIDVRQHAGGEFLAGAWAELRRVAPGRQLSYTEFSGRFGKPDVPRIGAMACSRNAAALFVPCHRIQRSDGSLGGFRYGLELKRDLIDHEACQTTAAP